MTFIPGAREIPDPVAEMNRLAGLRDKPQPMTEEDCTRHGGHCFEGTGEALQSSPPQYPEVCKHCQKRRVAVPREPFEYRDAP